MIRALYTATSGMMVEARKMDLASKNLFHAQTPGYKAAQILRAAQAPTGGGLASDVQTAAAGEWLDPSAGPLRYTNKQLDLALEGSGFFSVQTPGGPAVTRDGRFQVGPDKVVRDFSGNALLAEAQGEVGPLRFPDDAKWDAKIQVDEDGTCYVGGEEIGKLVLRDYAGYRGLQAAGGSLYFPTAAAQAGPSQARVAQYALEDANTSALQEMTRTIEITRAFEAYQKTIVTVMDEATAQAVRMGRVA